MGFVVVETNMGKMVPSPIFDTLNVAKSYLQHEIAEDVAYLIYTGKLEEAKRMIIELEKVEQEGKGYVTVKEGEHYYSLTQV